MGAEGIMENLQVRGLVGRGRRWTTSDPDRPGIGRSAKTKCLDTKAFLLQLGLLGKPAMKPDMAFPTLENVAARCLARLAPSPFRSGGEGEDGDPLDGQVGVIVKQASLEGMAKLVDGFVAPDCVGKGAINPS